MQEDKKASVMQGDIDISEDITRCKICGNPVDQQTGYCEVCDYYKGD